MRSTGCLNQESDGHCRPARKKSVIALIMSLLLFPCVSWAADNQPSASPSLDDQLLEELEAGMTDLESPADSSQLAPSESSKPTDQSGPNQSDLDQLLLETIGKERAGKSDPLTSIGGKMQRAGKLIGARKAAGETQELQHEIIHDLDELLKQARKKSSKSSQQNQKSQRDRPSQPSSEQSQEENTQQASNQPARDSEAQLQNRPTFGSKQTKNFSFKIGKQRKAKVQTFSKFKNLLPGVLAPKSEHCKFWIILMFVPDLFLYQWQLSPAWPAPGCKEINQHDFSFVISN